jgi:uncharacterized protein YprB with RNaseH-like and TPR domain
MSVKDRLKRLTGEGQPVEPTAAKQERIGELRRKIDAIMARRAAYPWRMTAFQKPGPARDLCEVITGEEVKAGCGACFFSRTTFRNGSYHGDMQVSRFAQSDMKAAALLAGHPEIAAMDISEALFLDTETTGLSGGTGTFAFLIGLGWCEGQDFVVCQLFARDFHEEAPMLTMLKEMASEKRCLVTFNGRAFDLNLLSARFVLNRLPDPLAGMPHLDLLPVSRRLAGHRLANCRLATLESEVLGFSRSGDVPGWEIPGRYFAWLRSRDGSLLEDVFHHNRLDVVSMAALVVHFSELLTRGGGHPCAHPGDLLAAALLHLCRGDMLIAVPMLKELAGSPDPLVAREAMRHLSLVHKQAGGWKEAARIWQDMLCRDPFDLFAAEELAKWLEHRRKDHAGAIDIVEALLAGSPSLTPSEREKLSYRLERLRRKSSQPKGRRQGRLVTKPSSRP